jgi:hypothetical protein
MQELVNDELIAYGSKQAGVADRPPGWQWNGDWLQAHHDWRVTAAGRADAKLYRDQLARERSERPAASANAAA